MKTENVQDIYELSPVQNGILFHSLYAPETGLYLIQFSFTLRGHLDIVAFDRAWQEVTARHTILRTSFYWQEIDKPLQVVHQQVKVPLEQYDWRGIDPVEQEKTLSSFLVSDRQKGFDISQAPLMRLTVIRLAENTYQFVWSKHHLILDGWSGSLLLEEVFQIYKKLSQSQHIFLAPCRPFKDYIAWLQKQDLSKAEVFWRQMLNGIKAPTPLTYLELENLSSQEEKYDEQQIKISAVTTEILQSLARQHQLTLNTLFQGAWAILLSRYSCQSQVVYGCGVSGRPVDLEGVESMVGVFINTLPVCVKLNSEQYLLAFLKELQAQQVKMRQYEYSPLVEIQGWSEVPRGMPLFKSIVVFENYPMTKVLQNNEEDLELLELTGFYKTNYPLNVIGYPGSELVIGINYDCQLFDAATITGILQDIEILLKSIANNPHIRLQDLSLLTSNQQKLASMLEKEITFSFV